MPDLIAPSDLPRQASDSENERVIGSSFSAELPFSRVTAEADAAVYTPAAGSMLGDAAYATYPVSVRGDLLDPPEIELGWTAGTAPQNGCWLGLANWSNNRWDWYYVADSTNLSLPELAPYLNQPISFPYAQVFMVVLHLDGAPARLDWLRLGANMEPVGYLNAEKVGEPRTLRLTLCAWDPDGSVASVGWDFESDGEIDAWDDYDVEHDFPVSTDHQVTVQLVDDDGSSGSVHGFLKSSSWFIVPQPLNIFGNQCQGVALDSAGAVHAVYTRETKVLGLPYNWLIYTTNAGGAWREEALCQLDYLSAQMVMHSDQPCILVSDQNSDSRFLIFTRSEAGLWQSTELTDSGYTEEGMGFAVDAEGGFHLAYQAWGTSGFPKFNLRYASSTGGLAFGDVPPLVDQDLSGNLVLALDRESRPHITWSGSLTDTCTYVFWDGEAWQAETVPDNLGKGRALDLLVDDAMQPQLVYKAETTENDYALRCATKDGGGWQIDTIMDPYVGSEIRLALDSTDQLMLAANREYVDLYPGEIRFIRLVGTDWLTEEVDASLVRGYLFGFGLDPLGRPWMSYDNRGLNLATRLD